MQGINVDACTHCACLFFIFPAPAAQLMTSQKGFAWRTKCPKILALLLKFKRHKKAECAYLTPFKLLSYIIVLLNFNNFKWRR